MKDLTNLPDDISNDPAVDIRMASLYLLEPLVSTSILAANAQELAEEVDSKYEAGGNNNKTGILTEIKESWKEIRKDLYFFIGEQKMTKVLLEALT